MVVSSMAEYSKSQVLVPKRTKSGAVNALLFFAGGTMLASDDQFLRIWDVRSGECHQQLQDPSWGQITNLSLLDDAATPSLFVGTARGVISIFSWNTRAQGFEKRTCATYHIFTIDNSVESQAVDSLNSRFLAGSTEGQIKMYSIRDRKTLEHLWTARVASIPRGVFFLGDTNDELVIYTIKGGPVLSIDPTTGDPRPSSLTLPSGTGFVALSPNRRTKAIHNALQDHFEIYTTNSSSPAHLTVAKSSGNIKGAAFAEDGNTLVCGGDDGFIHIFDVITGLESQGLGHDDCSTVYALTTCTTEHYHLLASGGSELPAKIYIWAKPTERKLHEDHQALVARKVEAARVEKVAADKAAAAAAAKIIEEKERAQKEKIAHLKANFGCLLLLFASFVVLVGFIISRTDPGLPQTLLWEVDARSLLWNKDIQELSRVASVSISSFT
ncbi:WD40-repeat-containing domain protein [Mycena olivaceomarginata]|nr:WD40-repeat-containing domain protein [Mycena olivaceomarginata]